MKKIMTVLLSVALLFSFAACDSNAVNPYFGKQVVSVTVSDYPEYVENEVLDPADVVFAVRYDDNTTVNKTGAELGMAPASTQTTGFKLADGYNAFEVKYGTDKEGNPLPAWSAKIVAHQVSSVTINAASATTVADVAKVNTSNTDKVWAADTTGLAYTANYGKNQSKAISAEIASGILGTVTYKLNGRYAVGEDLTVAATSSKKVEIKFATPWIVTLEESSKVVSSWNLVFAEGQTKKFFNLDNAKPVSGTSNGNTLGEVAYYLVLEMADGKEVEIAKSKLSSNDYGVATVKFREYADTYKFDSKSGTNYLADVTFTPKGVTKAQQGTATLTVEFTEDYPTKIEATNTTDGYKDGDPISVSDFTFVASEYASGVADKKTEGFVSDDITLLTTSVPFGSQVTSGDKEISVNFEYAPAGIEAIDFTGKIKVLKK